MCRNIIPYYSNANPNNSYRVGLLQEGVIDIEFTALSSTATLGLGGDLPQAINIGGSTPEVAVSLSKLLFIQYPVMQQINPLLYSYRYGFNGKERVNELNSSTYNFGARMYDARVGRFFSTDLLKAKYPSESHYSFAGNSPIAMVDAEGMDKTLYIFFVGDNGNTKLKLEDKREIIRKVKEVYARNGMPDINVVGYNTNKRQNLSTFDATDQAIYIGSSKVLSSLGLSVSDGGNSAQDNTKVATINLDAYDELNKNRPNINYTDYVAKTAAHESIHNYKQAAGLETEDNAKHPYKEPNHMSPGSVGQLMEQLAIGKNTLSPMDDPKDYKVSNLDGEANLFNSNSKFLQLTSDDKKAIQQYLYDGKNPIKPPLLSNEKTVSFMDIQTQFRTLSTAYWGVSNTSQSSYLPPADNSSKKLQDVKKIP